MIQLSIFLLIFASGVGDIHSGRRSVMLTNLRSGNLGNFHSKVQEGTMASRYMRGPVDPISL